MRILVQNCSLCIRNNLFLALKQQRDSENVVTVWADAICINESNIRERNEQVAAMADVYRQATDVYIWLGEKYPQSGQPLHLLAELVRTGLASFTGHQNPTENVHLSALSRLISRAH